MNKYFRSILPLFLLLIVNTLSASRVSWEYRILSHDIEHEIYFYHGNHLGSASWITERHGDPIQYIHYLPYGEILANQHTTYNERFKFTGKELDAESGYYYFGARYLLSELGNFISSDPLSDKYPEIQSYLYCNGNPIKYIDTNGLEWTDVDGNIIKDHSKIQAYIFYNPKDFKSQSFSKAIRYEIKYGRGTVALSSVITETEFAKDWQAMGGDNIREVSINHHGSNQAIHLDWQNDQYITSTGNGHTQSMSADAMNVSDLGAPKGNISNATLFLNTCHSNSTGSWLGNIRIGNWRIPGTSATLVGSKETIMQSFQKNFNFNSIRGTSAGVSYDRYLQPEPQFFFQSWTYFNRY